MPLADQKCAVMQETGTHDGNYAFGYLSAEDESDCDWRTF